MSNELDNGHEGNSLCGIIAHFNSQRTSHHEVAHRDVTPANIILGRDGPTLIDFGTNGFDLEHLATGTVMGFGTPGYASPEAESEGRVGAPADMLHLGG